MLVTAIIAIFSTAHFDGVLDMHAGLAAPAAVYFLDQLNAWGCAVLLFFIAGLIFSASSVRLIDIAGTMALARWPMLIVSILCFGFNTSAAIRTMNDITPSMIIISLISIVFTIWMIALMYNAFRVAANVKGGTAIGAFIGALILAEILSHYLSYQLYRSFHLPL